MEVIYNDLKKLYEQVVKDKKKGIKRLYLINLGILKTHIDDNPFGERFTKADKTHTIKSNTAMQRLWKSYQLCGGYANPPMARFDNNIKNLHVVQGNSRIIAASVIGNLQVLPINIVLPTDITEQQARQIVVDENTVRSAIGDYSRLMKIKQLREQGVSFADIAKERKVAMSTIYMSTAILKDKNLVNLVKTHTIGLGAASMLGAYRNYHLCMKSNKKSILEELFFELRQAHGHNKKSQAALKYGDIMPRSVPAIKKFCDLLIMIQGTYTFQQYLQKFKYAVQKISFINWNKLNKASVDQIENAISVLNNMRLKANV